MKEIVEKILTDKTARTPEAIEAVAITQNEFSSWN
jgi:hypothetical protein